LTVSDKCLNQIKYLCSRISKVEWSGILFYTVDKGDIESENLEMTAEFVYPMSKDTTAATGFEYNEDVMQFMMQHPECMNMRQGMIHSHHSMNSYFSQTDMSELADNCENHQFYLSMVVNNATDIVAKVGIHVEQEYKIHGSRNLMGMKGKLRLPFTQTIKETVLEHYDCDIYTYEPEVEKWFKDRTDKIIEDAKPKKVVGFNSPKEYVSSAWTWDNVASDLRPYNTSNEAIFIAKYLKGDLDYDGTIYKALEEINKSTQEKDKFIQAMVEGFDYFYDEFFETDGHQLDVLSKLSYYLDQWQQKFRKAHDIMYSVITELTTGYEPR